MGERPTSRLTLKVLGLDSGPFFPAQTAMPESYGELVRKAFEGSGILEWCDWTPAAIKD
jgi:hypothetical protein